MIIIKILICVVAVVLFGRGIIFLLKARLIWMLYDQIMGSYKKKIAGKIVDLEVRTKMNGDDTVFTNYPMVEYRKDEEEEMTRQSAGYDIVVESDSSIHKLYTQKTPHIGDKVIVLYGQDHSDSIFAFPNMPFTRLLCRLFLPGCIYALAGILGVCYVFI